MKLLTLGSFGKIFAFLAFLIDAVFAIDICYEDAYYYYYCEDGKECCNNDTACCDKPALSAGAIAGIVIGSICGLIIILWFLATCCKQSSDVGQAGLVAGTARVQTITLQQDPYSFLVHGQQATSYAHPADPDASELKE